MFTAEWRTRGSHQDVVLVLDDTGAVREALDGNQVVISRFLTEQLDDLELWKGDSRTIGEKKNPDSWGELILSRADTGEVLSADPELLWQGIYLWFRAYGVDYDSTSFLEKSFCLDSNNVNLRRSQLMDD